MKRWISLFALAALVGFISCDLVGPEALFLQDQVNLGPLDPQEIDQDSGGEICPDPWMDIWYPDSCETGPGHWMEYCSPDSSDINPFPEPDSSTTEGS